VWTAGVEVIGTTVVVVVVVVIVGGGGASVVGAMEDEVGATVVAGVELGVADGPSV